MTSSLLWFVLYFWYTVLVLIAFFITLGVITILLVVALIGLVFLWTFIKDKIKGTNEFGKAIHEIQVHVKS